MKIIFFGTPEYVVPIVDRLHKYHEIVAVVTQPPKPVGRDQIISYSAVDTWAHKKKIIKFFDFSDLPKADLGICASYGSIIPKEVINSFKFGILNIHPSLLPKYRGASPIQTAIANGETETGVTIIKMDEKMDHGPIVAKFKDEILAIDTFETLRTRLFSNSIPVLLDLIEPYSKGKVNPKAQDKTQVTFTKIVSKQDGFVDLIKDDPVSIERKLRAYSPWPGIWTLVDGKRLKILKAHIADGQLTPDEVHLEGKKPVGWRQFIRSYPKFNILNHNKI
ncbi:MAG: Methionyl-tRNA formyltransferase [Parcubacteria group bacterium GW2011_GWA1_38_7]|nr:MAG: Methionyl-tRNA formyltransferase [Parcubacteria group bacterium GW2011_GWA1_38_7]